MLADDPAWLNEAYTEAIAVRDIGLIGRNSMFAEQVDRVVNGFFPLAERFLDFGAGNGMFVRMMRDRGLDFRYFDAYGPNLFARGFELDEESGHADVVTALEVVEHLLHPVRELQPFVDGAMALFVSTVLVPERAPALDRWWYYSLESGQHITIFSRRSLEAFADQLGFHVTSIGDLHVFSRRRLPVRWLHAVLRFGWAIRHRRPRVSLLEHDFQLLFGEDLGAP